MKTTVFLPLLLSLLSLPLGLTQDTLVDSDATIDVAVDAGNDKSSTNRPAAIPKPRFYVRKHDVAGDDFYDFFNFEAIPDPTHGRVTYVDERTARREKLTETSRGTFILRTDDKTVLTPDGPGRKSVRLISKKAFTTHVAVFDVRHMPEGCGTWPAIWEVNPIDWPTGGEIDILEGVNNQPVNFATIHTTTGCTMPPSNPPGTTPSNRTQLGTENQNDCDWLVNWNAGCGVSFPQNGPPSFGPAFNQAGGGWFVLERTPTAMRVWFWTRNDHKVPDEVKFRHSLLVDPSKYGVPMAHFPNTQCDFNKYFRENNIVINLTLCGDWAGSDGAWAGAGCPAPSCKAFVEANPSAFTNAFFDIANIRIYETPLDGGHKRHIDAKRRRFSHDL